MRNYRLIATAAAVLMGMSSWTSAQQANPNAQQQQNAENARQSTQNDKKDKLDEKGRHQTCDPGQVAAITKNMKRSLADSITAAERHCGGRAVRAECRMRGGTMNKDASSSNDVVCVVTLLVDDKQLVEATVNSENGQVVNQRNLDSLMVTGDSSMSDRNAPRAASNSDRHRANDFAMAHRWQKATELLGRKVVNDNNEDLGKIEEIVVDAANGRVIYGVLSFGGFLGIGDKLFAIPWQSLELSGDGKAYVLSVDKDRLQNATGFDKGHWPNFADERWGTTTYAYYEQTPYWRTAGDNTSTDGNSTDGNNADRNSTDRNRSANLSSEDRWYAAPQLWQKTRDLCGKEVRNANNEQLGNVTDLVIDPDAGRILYAVVTYRDKLFAVPFSAIPLRQDAKFFELPGGKDLLQDSVSFTNNTWPNFTDRTWATSTYSHYRVEPYWKDR